MTLRRHRRGFTVEDSDGDFPPQMERVGVKPFIYGEIDNEGNFVIESDLNNGSTVILYIPVEAIIDLVNSNAEFVVNKSKTWKRRKK